jgi:hypothetical protein
MKIETYLNAMEGVWAEKPRPKFGTKRFSRRLRQHEAFRARILRMFEDQEDLIDGQRKSIRMRDRQIRILNQHIRENKDD